MNSNTPSQCLIECMFAYHRDELIQRASMLIAACDFIPLTLQMQFGTGGIPCTVTYVVESGSFICVECMERIYEMPADLK